jgi:hypothetical protein
MDIDKGIRIDSLKSVTSQESMNSLGGLNKAVPACAKPYLSQMKAQ